MTESPTPPVTGVADIDAALAEVRLDGPVDQHHQELSAAVDGKRVHSGPFLLQYWQKPALCGMRSYFLTLLNQ